MYIVESTSSRNQFPDTRSLIAGENFVVQQFLLLLGRLHLLSVVRVTISRHCLALGSVFHVSACQICLQQCSQLKINLGCEFPLSPLNPTSQSEFNVYN